MLGLHSLSSNALAGFDGSTGVWEGACVEAVDGARTTGAAEGLRSGEAAGCGALLDFDAGRAGAGRRADAVASVRDARGSGFATPVPVATSDASCGTGATLGRAIAGGASCAAADGALVAGVTGASNAGAAALGADGVEFERTSQNATASAPKEVSESNATSTAVRLCRAGAW
jgi:hypothetical protein